MKKIKTNQGCVGCQACTSVLDDKEKKIIENLIKLGDDGLMHSTNQAIKNTEEENIIKKMSQACPMNVIDIEEE